MSSIYHDILEASSKLVEPISGKYLVYIDLSLQRQLFTEICFQEVFNYRQNVKPDNTDGAMSYITSKFWFFPYSYKLERLPQIQIWGDNTGPWDDDTRYANPDYIQLQYNQYCDLIGAREGRVRE